MTPNALYPNDEPCRVCLRVTCICCRSRHQADDPDECGDTMTADELHDRYEQPGSGNDGLVWS